MLCCKHDGETAHEGAQHHSEKRQRRNASIRPTSIPEELNRVCDKEQVQDAVNERDVDRDEQKDRLFHEHLTGSEEVLEDNIFESGNIFVEGSVQVPVASFSS